MATSKQYVRKHTNKSAFTKHKAGLKKRNAIIDEIKSAIEGLKEEIGTKG
jgi:hypothetical protein